MRNSQIHILGGFATSHSGTSAERGEFETPPLQTEVQQGRCIPLSLLVLYVNVPFAIYLVPGLGDFFCTSVVL